MKLIKKTIPAIWLFLIVGAVALNAQEAQQPHPQGQQLSAEDLKKANDPMAHIKTFNVHNYIVSGLYNMPNAVENQLMFRYAQPIGKIILRGTLPIVTYSSTPTSDSSPVPYTPAKTGLGDFNLFAIYTIGDMGNKFGIGPLITAPTGTNDFSSEKWQAGVAALAFLAKNPQLQAGALLQWQTSFAGKDEAKDISLLTSQIFGIWQIGGGTYLRSTGIWSFDLETGDFSIPLGLGIGKVVKVGHVVFNIFAEPQYSVAAKGTNQSQFQTFIGFNTQF